MASSGCREVDEVSERLRRKEHVIDCNLCMTSPLPNHILHNSTIGWLGKENMTETDAQKGTKQSLQPVGTY